MVESTERLYNVAASKTGHVSDDLLRRGLAEKAGLNENKINALMARFQTMPTVRIGSSVPEGKAQKTKKAFEAAGLRIKLEPVLSLTALEQVADDGKVACPACDARVELTEDRQCPACDVYVDKVSPEFIARKKLEREDREKLKQMEAFARQKSDQEERQSREEQLREEIRRELEKELGISREKEKHRSPVAKAALMSVGALAFTVLGFGGGYMVSDALRQPEGQTVAAAGGSGQDMEGLDIENMPASGSISVEQAVDASTKLAASIGYDTPASLQGQSASTGLQQSSGAATEQTKQTAAQGGDSDGLHRSLSGNLPVTETVLSLLRADMPDAARDAVRQVSAVQAASQEAQVDKVVASLILEAWRLTAGQGERDAKVQKGLAETAQAMPDAGSRTQAFVALARTLSMTQPQLYSQNIQLIKQAQRNAAGVAETAHREHAVFSAFAARNSVLAAYVGTLVADGQLADAQQAVGAFAGWENAGADQTGTDAARGALAVFEQELPLQRALGNKQRVQQIVQASVRYFEAVPGYDKVEQMARFSDQPELRQNARFQELAQQSGQDLLTASDESGKLASDALRPMAWLSLLYYRGGEAEQAKNLEKWLTVELDANADKADYQQLKKWFGMEKARILTEQAHAAGNQPARDGYAAELVSLLP